MPLKGHGLEDGERPRCQCGERFSDVREFAEHCQEVERRRLQPEDVQRTMEGG